MVPTHSLLLSAIALAVALQLPQRCLSIACEDNAIRLTDGRTEQEGRLELCQDGVWGTVCNDPWSFENTMVVCRQLGIGTRGYYLNTFAFGNGPILLSQVKCTGEESQLTDCPSRGQQETTECYHSEDVGVVCIPSGTPPECEEGSLRLMDGRTPYDGRLEICLNNLWGTICNHLWDRNDAIVACRQLGINATGVYVESHSTGTGPILLSGLSCDGTEANLTDCSSDLVRLHDVCRHRNDVGVLCSIQTEPECTDGGLRLVNGRTEYEGRVEVCQDGLWGSVCDLNWRSENNALVCSLAGINATDAVFGSFGPVSGPIHLSSVVCNGTEESLFNCSHTNIRDANVFCYSSEPVGMICLTESDEIECSVPSVRLVDHAGLPAEGTGLVEICVSGKWSRVCHEWWDRREAAMICNQLGFTSSDGIGYLVDDGEYIGPVVSASCDNVEMNDNSSIYDCIGIYTCFQQRHGVVICTENEEFECQDGEVRIGNLKEFVVGTEEIEGGRLEMCYQGVWGTVCDDNWSIGNAIVACRQLGYKTEGARFIHEYHPPGSGPIILDDLLCTGAEATLLDCTHNPLNKHNCQVLENVGLYCEVLPTSSPQIPTAAESPADSTMSILIGVGVVILLLLLLLIVVVAVVAFFFRRRPAKRTRPPLSSLRERLELSTSNPLYNASSIPNSVLHANAYDLSLPSGVQLKVHRPSSPTSPNVRGSFMRKITEDFIIPLKHLTLLTKIGEGEFGVVYKTKLSGGDKINEVVAVKTLKGMYSQEEVDAMLEEGLKLKHFQHPNVLSLIGVCVDTGTVPYIVMPFMSNGSLLDYLRHEKAALVLSGNMDEEIVADVTKRLITMCQQISKGMKYLAGEKFIHRDLAARNCMIDESFMIKIADFGLSEDMYTKTYFRQQSNVGVKLPVKWMAVESLQEGIFSEKTDVWSYGVTCWEVFSGGKNPYPGISPMNMVDLLERGERLMQPNNIACTQKMYKLMKSCWNQDCNKRPTFSQIVDLLDKDLENLAGYMNMDCLFPEIKKQANAKGKVSKKRSLSFATDKPQQGLKPPAMERKIAESFTAPSRHL